MKDPVVQPESMGVFEASWKHTVPQSRPSMTSTPSHDDIARRAYEIYVKTGSHAGRCQQNWLQAERELRKQTLTPGPAEPTVAPGAPRSGSEPEGKTFAGALPSIKGTQNRH